MKEAKTKPLLEIVVEWQEILRQTDASILDNAWAIASAADCPNWEALYNFDQGGDRLFAEVYDIATQLETADGVEAERQAKWRHLERLVELLAERYIKKLYQVTP